MQCPDCSGPMYDNRETKRNAKQPDFKCKDRNCGKAIWLKPKAGPQNGSPPPQTSRSTERPAIDRKARFAEVRVAYAECIAYVVQKVVPVLRENQIATSQEGVNSMAFSIFKATYGDPRDIDLRKPEPPKPKPAPMPEEEEEDDIPF